LEVIAVVTTHVIEERESHDGPADPRPGTKFVMESAPGVAEGQLRSRVLMEVRASYRTCNREGRHISPVLCTSIPSNQA